MVGTLKSAIGIEVSNTVLKRGIQAIESMQHSNPMNYLKELPANYIGELNNADPSTIDGFQWYFDLDTGYLVYRVNSDKHFSSSLTGPSRIRFAIKLDYTDINNNGQFDNRIDRLNNVILISLDSYQWINPSEE